MPMHFNQYEPSLFELVWSENWSLFYYNHQQLSSKMIYSRNCTSPHPPFFNGDNNLDFSCIAGIQFITFSSLQWPSIIPLVAKLEKFHMTIKVPKWIKRFFSLRRIYLLSILRVVHISMFAKWGAANDIHYPSVFSSKVNWVTSITMNCCLRVYFGCFI